MAQAQPSAPLTEAEYLRLERAADFRSEFFDGEMFAMAGGSESHSLIAANLIGELRQQLRGRGSRAYEANLRIKVEATGLFTYPDASVICGPPAFVDEAHDCVTNPTLVAEVLSDSTEAYDRGEKFRHYRLIPALQSCLFLSQKQALVEHFVRATDGRWTLHTAEGMQADLEIAALGIRLALAEIYLEVAFSPLSLRALPAKS